MEEYKAVHVGFGEMGKVIVSYLFEKKIDVIGVFNKTSNIHSDISEFICYGKGIRIKKVSELGAFLAKNKPDVCTVSTSTRMCDLSDILMSCARNGINAITIGEEAIYPWYSSPTIVEKLDKIAKTNNCTISGSGYQDIFWGEIPCILATTVQKAQKIKVFSRYGLNGCGPLIFEDHGCGISISEFEEKFCRCNFMSPAEQIIAVQNGKVKPSLMWMMNDWICDKLQLTPILKKQYIEPVVNDFPVYMEAHNRWVEPGFAAGLKAIVTTETKEGIIIESTNIGKVDVPDEGGLCSWTVEGEPNLNIIMSNPDDIALTCSSVVNRIPALIQAPAGYITTNKLENSILWGNY